MRLKIKFIVGLLSVSAIFYFVNITFSQDKTTVSDDSLTAGKRSAIIDKITEVFNGYYPLPDVAEDMTKYINQKHKKGEYDPFTDLVKFTSQLTADLRSISKDFHIRVSPYEKIPDDLLVEIKLGSPDDNYGFQKVERLLGNIGYLELTSFNNPKSAGPTAIAAMNFLAHCDALIIDLRLNGGGDEAMATFLSSYFFDKSTYLTDLYIRKDDKTEQRCTQEWVPGPKMTDIPIYILLSRFSYSSTEAFSYQLQQLGRAVIVGEKTRGGAHGVRYMSFQELSINLKVPYTQDINPYSKTNYIEGIIPDVAASEEKALVVANIEAAKKLLETETDKKKKYKLEWILARYRVDLHPVIFEDATLAVYAGVYENVKMTHECGKLFLQRNSREKQELVPMGDDLFKFKDPNEVHYRVQFVRDENGKVIKLYDLDSDGDRYPEKKRTDE
jgi:hypothetical protein